MISVYVFGVIIAVLFVAGLVVAPLLEDEPADPDAPEGTSAEDRREAALEALEELEFEHETGKLSDEDYRRLRNKYARAAVATRDESAAASGGDPVETPRCPDCGAEADRGDRFCPRCGADLAT